MHQSAYLRHHSTETAFKIVHNDIVRPTDSGLVSVLVLLLSAAFEIVDHNILIDILSKRFELQRHELDWFQSYYTGGSQTFSTSNDISGPVALTCNVTQGSVLGPKEFVVYMEDTVETIDKFAVNHHVYADDSQLLTHMCLETVAGHRRRPELCVEHLGDGAHRDGCNLIQTKQS